MESANRACSGESSQNTENGSVFVPDGIFANDTLRRRSKAIPRFMSEESGLGLTFEVLVDASAGWHGFKITPAAAQQLEALRQQPSAKASSRLAA